MKSYHIPNTLETWDAWPFYYGSMAISTVYLNNSTYDDGVRRGWRNMRTKHPLHPAIDKIVNTYRPLDWQQLLLEWPHVSTTDPSRLAYSRDERSLKEDRQQITTLGKYIKRHWPTMPDHMIRDYVAVHGSDVIELWDTSERIIAAVELGPRSCMKSTYGSIPFSSEERERLEEWFDGDLDTDEVDWDAHPYRVYDPVYGWAVAVRYRADRPFVILGRAVVNTKEQCFVRTYARDPNGEERYSEADHAIEAWLVQQGYEKRRAWPEGVRFRWVPHPHGSDTYDGTDCSEFMMPYLDGDDRAVSEHYRDGESYIELDYDGEWICEETSGHASRRTEENERCECCGDYFHSDEVTYVGRHEDVVVCFSCRDNSYVEVRGSSVRADFRWYYVHSDDACDVISPEGNTLYCVDAENLPDSVVCDVHGDYRRLSDCFKYDDEYYLYDDGWLSAEGDWYPNHMEYIIFEGEKWLKDDCWQCTGTGLWYPNSEDCLTDDRGEPYHPSYTTRVSSDAEEGDDALVVLRTAFEEYVTVYVPLPSRLIPATSPESVELAAELYI